MTPAAIDIHQLLEVESEHGRVVVRGSRLWIDRLIALHLGGYSPQEIAEAFPALSLSAVYAALSYYYEHQQEMDERNARDSQASMAAARALGAEIL